MTTRHASRWCLLALFLPAMGCMIAPHSFAIGRPASLPGVSQAEVSVSIGGAYEASSEKSTPSSSGEGSYTLTLPSFEGNVLFGVARRIGLNLHVSAAGLQPGVQIVVVDGPLSIAVVPQVAVGYFRTASTEDSDDALDRLSLLGGGRLLISHDSGIYGGLGYDFQYTRQRSDGSSERSLSNDGMIHNLNAGVGYSIKLGSIALRPEIAFLYYPSAAFSSSSGSSETSFSGWSVMPMLTIAAGAKR